MPTFRLRKHWIDRLLKDARKAGEIGLAFLMTAGVVHCGATMSGGADGGDTEGDGSATDGSRSVDGAGSDSQIFPEAPCCIEAAQFDGGGFVDAVSDASSDGAVGSDATIAVEAAMEAGTDSQLVVEAATDATFDHYTGVVAEAPTP